MPMLVAKQCCEAILEAMLDTHPIRAESAFWPPGKR